MTRVRVARQPVTTPAVAEAVQVLAAAVAVQVLAAAVAEVRTLAEMRATRPAPGVLRR